MNRLRHEQRLPIVEFYYQNACSVKKVLRALLPFYGQFNRPTEATIRAIVTKFRTRFTLLDIKPLICSRRVRTEKNIAADRAVLMMTINYRFVAVRSNWACRMGLWKVGRSLTCMTCGFNKAMPHGTQHE